MSSNLINTIHINLFSFWDQTLRSLYFIQRLALRPEITHSIIELGLIFFCYDSGISSRSFQWDQEDLLNPNRLSASNEFFVGLTFTRKVYLDWIKVPSLLSPSCLNRRYLILVTGLRALNWKSLGLCLV